jgi:hypothetical protein
MKNSVLEQFIVELAWPNLATWRSEVIRIDHFLWECPLPG